ncbi:hypothetical protein G6539_15675, partial [Streptomyces albidoflavus]|nr:hypothetical protein [Streptomyces albidoflavus]
MRPSPTRRLSLCALAVAMLSVGAAAPPDAGAPERAAPGKSPVDHR